MRQEFIVLVYDTLADLLVEPCRVPGVENAFTPGSPCDLLYIQVYKAKQRICHRLDVESDPDVELLIQNLEEISRILGRKMYACGSRLERS